jgi:hypothetical protein
MTGVMPVEGETLDKMIDGAALVSPSKDEAKSCVRVGGLGARHGELRVR